MNRITASVIAVTLSLFVVIGTASSLEAPAVVTTTTEQTIVAETTSTTTTTITVPIPPAARCPMWWSLAVQQGFTLDEMPTLDRILYRESRCDPTAHNSTDPNTGSFGLTQVNGFWCRSSQYHEHGYLQAQSVLTHCDDLYDPATNLRAALALVEYSRSRGFDQWKQWWWLESDSSDS